jgi:hypothetical protein
MNLATNLLLETRSEPGVDEKRKLVGLGVRAKPRMASFANTAGVEVASHALSLTRPGEEQDESEGYGI